MPDVQFDPILNEEVKISDEAEQQLKALIDAEEEITGVRIFVSGGGCGGMSYGMTFVESPSEYDCVKQQGDVKVYVDAVALGFLSGVEIDYRQEGLNRSFVFKNVFASTGGSGACGGCS